MALSVWVSLESLLLDLECELRNVCGWEDSEWDLELHVAELTESWN